MTITPKSRAPSPEAGGLSVHGLGAELRLDGMRPPRTNYLAGVLLTLGCTAAAGVMSIWFAPTNLVMVYLLGVVFASARIDRRASVVSSLTAGARRRDGRAGRAAAKLAIEFDFARSENSIGDHLRQCHQFAAGGEPIARGLQRQMVEIINEEAGHMAHMINNILDMTRLESGSVQLDVKIYLLEEVLGAVLARLKEQLGGRTLSIDIPRDLPMLQVDGVLFEKVLINISENAAKYTPADAHIDVSASHQGGEIQVKVADDGAGLPEGSEQQVFEKFYRGHAEGAVAGTGLGPALCRAIIEVHGGRVWTEGHPAGGAIFGLALPLSRAADKRAERRRPRKVAGSRPTRWHSQGIASLFALLPGQFACAIPLAPRRLACRPQGIECPWHDRTAVITYYAVFAALIVAVVVFFWLRAASRRPGRNVRQMW